MLSVQYNKFCIKKCMNWQVSSLLQNCPLNILSYLAVAEKVP
jgi:hypothetical protein